MTAIMGADHEQLTRWNTDAGRLALWCQENIGCVLHVTGHWVALTRPEGVHTEQVAALLCDSLSPQPFALSAEHVGELFAVIAAFHQGAALQRAGEWSVYVTTR